MGGNVAVDYDLVTGVGALASGTQGVLGGSGTANTYIGADGQQHLLPAAGAATTHTMSSSGNTLTSVVNGVSATANAVNSVSNAIVADNLTTTVNGVSGTPVDLSSYLDNTDNQALSISGNVISLTNGGTVTLPAQTSYTAGTGISITGSTIDNTGDLSNTNEIQSLSISGSNLSISGGNTVSLPSGDITSTSTGLSITNGTGRALGGNVAVDYDLVTGIGALASGTQGALGGIGAANTYIGADGQQHLLPSAAASTTHTMSSSGNTLTSVVNETCWILTP